VNDVLADEVRQLRQLPPEPSILLEQGVDAVGMFVAPKCRFILSNSIFLE